MGRLGEICFPAGAYAYVGSARRGFKARLSRYLKPIKKHHWHIDYLLRKASLSHIFLAPGRGTIECRMARNLGLRLEAVPGFGSSDCRCPGHLFFAATGEAAQSAVAGALGSPNVAPIMMETADIRAALDL